MDRTSEKCLAPEEGRGADEEADGDRQRQERHRGRSGRGQAQVCGHVAWMLAQTASGALLKSISGSFYLPGVEPNTLLLSRPLTRVAALFSQGGRGGRAAQQADEGFQ